MNVNALNSMTSMQKITSAPAFKACSCDKEVSKPAQKQNLSGLEALAAMLTPHKHYVQIDFDNQNDKTFKLTSGIATIDNSENEVVSSLQIDKKEGKTKSDIINSLLRDTTNLKEFSITLNDNSIISVMSVPGVGQNFVTTLTKGDKTEVIQEFSFGKENSKQNDIDAFKKVIGLAMTSFNQEKIASVKVATQR